MTQMSNDKCMVENAWQEYHQRLFSFIRARVATSEEAEDILSDVYVKLAAHSLKAHSSKEGQVGNVLSWLYTVTKNSIIDHYRSAKPQDDLPKDLMAEEPVAGTYNALSGCILPMIQSLPENYRKVIELSDIEGKKQQDVADLLGLSLSAVKSRVLRGRGMLRQSLADCCTLFFNNRGQLMDFEQKPSQDCKSCSD